MKCPKCGYLGFEALDRCRNCGYDFSLTASSSPPELPLRSKEADSMQMLDDLALAEPAARGQNDGARRDDLPLFGPVADDVPLVGRPSAPRQPLSVRRAAPDVARVRAEQRPSPSGTMPLLDLEPPDASSRSTGQTPSSIHLRGTRATPDGKAIARGKSVAAEPAGVGARVVAVLVDTAVLAVIDAVVIYFTMQICGLTTADIGILPKAPLIAFLLAQNGGYLVTFTAGGQTLGKMAAGIRVVSTSSDGSVDLGHSVVRTLVWALLATPAGLGFVTALFSRDRRGLHDRCAGTRVVRAAA